MLKIVLMIVMLCLTGCSTVPWSDSDLECFDNHGIHDTIPLCKFEF